MSQTLKPEVQGNISYLHFFNKLTQKQLNKYKALWVIGLIVLPILICTQIFKLYTYSYQWYQYIVFGSVYPLFFLVISLVRHLFGTYKKVSNAIKLMLLLVFAFGIAIYFVMAGIVFIFIAAILAILQVLLSRKFDNNESSAKLAWFPQFALTTVAWSVSLPFAMTDFGMSLAPNSPLFAFAFLIIVTTLLLVHFNVYFEKKQTTSFRFLSLSNVIAVLIIALFSFRTDDYFYIISFHHWGVIVGSAEMVRQGGWLLWDVPSQYGFLSTLLLSWLPGQSLWLNLYIVSGLLNFLIGIFVFYSLRWPYNTTMRFWFALALTLTSIFVRANIAEPGLYRWEGVDVYPSSGGFRYFWCYVLLLILFWQYRFRYDPKIQTKVFWIGNIVWLVSIFWSAESGVYCSAIWLPAFVTMVIQHTIRQAQGQFRPMRIICRIIGWLFVPLCLMIVSVGVIEALYISVLGHAPDWKNYLDYAAGTDYFQIPPDAGGVIWAFLGVYCFLCIFGLQLLRKGLANPQLVLFLGFFGLVWSTSSYYIVREAPGADVNSAPFISLVLTAGLLVGQKQFKEEVWFGIYRLFAVTVLTMLIVIGICKPSAIIFSFTQTTQNINVEQKLPTVDENLNQLFTQAQVKPNDPIVYTGDINLLPSWYYQDSNNQRLVANTPTWLPIYPDALLHVLPLERRQTYIDRFTNHLRLSGWLVERISGEAETGFEFDESTTWLHRIINDKYRPTKSFSNDYWRITWYQIKS